MSDANDYTLALVSSMAYEDPLGDVDGWQVMPGTAHWAGDFFAVAFQSSTNANDVVIAFRGTDVLGFTDTSADAAIANPLPAWDAQFDEALGFAQQIILANPGKHISVTGHSLGGSLAQVAAHMFGLDGATFDPGGAQNLTWSSAYAQWVIALTSFSDQHPELNLTIDHGPGPGFVNYLVEHSAVSGWSGGQLGNTEQLDFFAQATTEELVISSATQVAHFLLGSIGSLAEAVTGILTTAMFHSIDGILDLMRIRAGDEIPPLVQQQIQQTIQQAADTGDVAYAIATSGRIAGEYRSTTYNPFVFADDGANVIYGIDGDDSIYALAGNDIVFSGNGNNIVNSAQGDDIIHAGSGNDKVFAGTGNDSISTGAGNDTVDAGSGDDVIDVGQGSAFVEGGAGQDRLTLDLTELPGQFAGQMNYSFGDGNGSFLGTYNWATSFEVLRSALAGVGEFQIFGNGLVAHYRNIESVNLTTGSREDLLIFQGGTQYDGGPGIDAFYADFSSTAHALTWDADAGTFTPVDGVTVVNIERFLVSSGSGNDVFRAMQGEVSHHLETGAGDDTVTLGAGNDYVASGTGNDGISTGAGNDTVDAGSGDDVIDVGQGSAFAEGGAGQDRLTLDLTELPGQFAGQMNYSFGDGNGSFLGTYNWATSFEVLRSALAGVGEFQIFGNGLVAHYRNIESVNLTTGSREDLLIFQGGTQYDGGPGIDAFYADFSSTAHALTWDADAGTFTPVDGVTVVNIERFLVSSGSGNDVFRAMQGEVSHHLETGAGDDTVTLGAGNDYVASGTGNDGISTGAGNDTVDAGSGDDVIDVGQGSAFAEGGAGQDRLTLDLTELPGQFAGQMNYSFGDGNGSFLGTYNWATSFEVLRSALAGVGEFQIFGNGLVAHYRNIESVNLTTGSREDLLIFQGGTQYDGGPGIDAFYADFSSTAHALTWDADAGTFTPVDGVTVVNIERFLVSSGSGNDVFRATEGGLSHHVETGAGADIVELGAGGDYVDAGSGNDTISTGAGSDIVYAGAGEDVIDGGADNDTLTGGTGGDAFHFAASGNGVDTITDFESDDVLRLAGVNLSSSSFVGSGVELGADQVHISNANGITTVLVGVDAVPGADVTIQLQGTFSAGSFVANGTDIGLAPTNHPPIGTPTAVLATGTEDTGYSIVAASLLQGFSDVDGDTLAVSSLGADHGVLVDNGNGTWTFTAVANYNGPVSLTYSVIDGNGGSIAAAQGFALEAVNDVPLGTPTAVLAAGTEDTAYPVSAASLLAGFSDVDGETLSISNLAANHGALVDNGNVTWTFTPDADYNGPVSLGYSVVDGNGGSLAAIQGFTLTPINDAPVLSQPLADASALVGQSFQYLVPAGTFTDVDAGDVLTLSATLVDGLPLPAWLSFNPSTRSVSGTPGAGDAGTLTVRVLSTDPAGASAFDDFQLEVSAANSAPLAAGDAATLLRNTTTIVPVRANDSDPNGDTMTVTAVTQGAHGTVVLDSGTGNPKYTPVRNYIGTDSFTYTVSDGKGGSAMATVSLLVASQMGDDAANTMTGKSGADVIAGLGGVDVISSLAGNDIIDGGDGDDTLRGGTGTTDVVGGGAGNDTIQVTGSEMTGDAIDGGADADTLLFLGNVTLGSAGVTMVGVEVLDMASFSLTVQGTKPLDLSELALLRPGTITGDTAANTVVGTSGDDDINGGNSGDLLKGGTGDDVIRGGSGADIITGGPGNDSLYGGSNSTADRAIDKFVFNAPLDSGSNVDTITGFEATARDRIVLDPTIFVAVAQNGTSGLDSGEFRANSGGTPLDANDFVLYDTGARNLYYDPDGNGAAGKLLFATLVGQIGTLDVADFTTDLPPGS